MDDFKCPWCEYSHARLNSLSRHVIDEHGKTVHELRVEIFNGGNIPYCICGCGELTRFCTNTHQFKSYIRGHVDSPRKGKTNSEMYGEERAAAMSLNLSKSRKERFASGELVPYNKGRKLEDYMDTNRANDIKRKVSDTKKRQYESGLITPHNKGKTFEELYGSEGARRFKTRISSERKRKFESGEYRVYNRGKKLEDYLGKERAEQLKSNLSNNTARNEKISTALTGKKKSSEHVEKIRIDRKKYWGNEDNRSEQRHRRMQYFIRRGLVPTSKLETVVAGMLDELGIEYYTQFYVREITSLFDFKIKGKNILIEVDGDFWHSNPKKYPNGPKYAAQIANAEGDTKKSQWASENGFQLIRIWEDEINNDIAMVKDRLMHLTNLNSQ